MSKRIKKQPAVASTASKANMENTASQRVEVVIFTLAAPAKSEVFVAGTFNKWSPHADRLTDKGGGVFSKTLHIPRGRHEYKFIVNGQWFTDPKNTVCVSNTYGGMNNVLLVE